MTETTASNARPRVVRAILAGVVLFEAIIVFGYGLYVVVEAITSTATEPTAAVALAGFALALGAGLALLARAGLRGQRGARAPIIVWQVLQASLYPAFSVRWYAGFALIASAIVAACATFVPGVLHDGDPEQGGERGPSA